MWSMLQPTSIKTNFISTYNKQFYEGAKQKQNLMTYFDFCYWHRSSVLQTTASTGTATARCDASSDMYALGLLLMSTPIYRELGLLIPTFVIPFVVLFFLQDSSYGTSVDNHFHSLTFPSAAMAAQTLPIMPSSSSCYSRLVVLSFQQQDELAEGRNTHMHTITSLLCCWNRLVCMEDAQISIKS